MGNGGKEFQAAAFATSREVARRRTKTSSIQTVACGRCAKGMQDAMGEKVHVYEFEACAELCAPGSPAMLEGGDVCDCCKGFIKLSDPAAILIIDIPPAEFAGIPPSQRRQ